jgi:hypothetical protein
VFALFARKRATASRITLNEPPPAAGESPTDPQAQVDLVCETVAKLEQVREMVRRLPCLPVGSRQELLAQLATTSDSLRSLYFLDAIY